MCLNRLELVLWIPDHRYCSSGDQRGIRYGASRLRCLSNVYPDIKSSNKHFPNLDLFNIKAGPNSFHLIFRVDNPNSSLAIADSGFLIRQ